jgi:hypothetical protein
MVKLVTIPLATVTENKAPEPFPEVVVIGTFVYVPLVYAEP